MLLYQGKETRKTYDIYYHMKPISGANEKYIEELAKRRKSSKVYSSHQLIGLNIAMILDDADHKSLYIKLAKEEDGDYLLQLAKSIAEKRDVENYGAYFMSVLKNKKKS